MRYLGEAAFWLTLVAVGVAFYLSAGRGLGPGRLLGESWPLMILVVVLVALSMAAGWLFVRLAGAGERRRDAGPAGGDEGRRPRRRGQPAGRRDVNR